MKIIILAGGSGTRLWPLSRNRFPKQFIKLKGMEHSIFQLTMLRCLKLAPLEDIYIVTNKDFQFLVSMQIDALGQPTVKENILLEPQAKNTLPAIYNGVSHIRKNRGDDVAAVFPCDHLIDDNGLFTQIITSAVPLTDTYLVTFGVTPTNPETGYGYIKPGAKLPVGFAVERFAEKPTLEKAKEYVANNYYWNAGMFLFRTDLFTEEVQKYSPDVARAFEGSDVEQSFARAPSISIDYGLMELSRRVAVVPMTVGWNDLGSFASFYEQYSQYKDEKGNVCFDKNEILIDSTRSMVYSENDKAVAVIGVDDLVVVDLPDALLVCKGDQTQKVKEVVASLRERHDQRADLHVTAYRPWGSYTILEELPGHKVKRLSVLPGKKLSYQMHRRRSEYWTAVSGKGIVVLDGQEIPIQAGKHVFIDVEQKHRLINNGTAPLEVIEVQCGGYLGEDDIVRFEDDFGRC